MHKLSTSTMVKKEELTHIYEDSQKRKNFFCTVKKTDI